MAHGRTLGAEGAAGTARHLCFRARPSCATTVGGNQGRLPIAAEGGAAAPLPEGPCAELLDTDKDCAGGGTEVAHPFHGSGRWIGWDHSRDRRRALLWLATSSTPATAA